MGLVLIASTMLVLHTVEGGEITINPSHVAALYPSSEATKGTPNKMVVRGARCVVLLGNSRFYSVVEECSAIRKMMERTQ